MKPNFKNILIALLLVVSAAFGQTVLTSTTLSAAIDNRQAVITVASATNITAPGVPTSTSLGGPNSALITLLVVDQEAMRVNQVNGTTISVQRAVQGTLISSHNNSSTVWVGPASAFPTYIPSGQCTRANLTYVPLISLARTAFAAGTFGGIYDCLGVGTAGQWTRTDAPWLPVFGSTVASPAGVMTPTGTAFKVSGVNAVTGITVPAGWAAGMSIAVIPTGTWTWTTATNISLAGTAVVGKTIFFTWDGSKWNPSVVG